MEGVETLEKQGRAVAFRCDYLRGTAKRRSGSSPYRRSVAMTFRHAADGACLARPLAKLEGKK